MSFPEILHRVREQLVRRVDRFSVTSWDKFGQFQGRVGGLPALSLENVRREHSDAARNHAVRLVSGQIEYLGCDWPTPRESGWWSSRYWHVDPVSGNYWPGKEVYCFDVEYRRRVGWGDIKFCWELNRLQFLPALALDAAVRGDGEAAAIVWEILGGWMEFNPPRRGVHWSSGIELASRLVSVLAAVSLIGEPQDATGRWKLRAFVDAHVRWIWRYPSLYSSANNHRVAEAAGLFLAALCVPDMVGADVIGSTARSVLERGILNLFSADGVGGEHSPTYAAYSLEWFALAGIVASASGVPLSNGYQERAVKAAACLASMLDGQGRIPAIGDDDEGRVLVLGSEPQSEYVASVVDMVSRWHGGDVRLCSRPTLRDLLDGAAASSKFDGVVAQAQSVGRITYEEGGYSVWRRRSKRGECLLIFDHAPLGYLSIAAHGHADALSIWYGVNGDPVFVDAGTYLYHAGHGLRDLLRGTGVHNTLSLEGVDQSRIVGPFAWAEHAKAKIVEVCEDAVVAEHDGYLRKFGVSHRRRVECKADGELLIRDTLRLGRHGPIAWSSGLNLHPSTRCVLDGSVALLTTQSGIRLRLSASGDGSGEAIEWKQESVPYSPRFNSIEQTSRLTLCGTTMASGVVSEIEVRLE